MSDIQIPNWYVEQWRRSAFHVFQSKGFKLRGTVTPPIKIDGSKLHFRKVGKAVAEEDVGPGDKAKRQNLSRDKITVETKKSRAFFEVDEDDMDLTQVNLPQINGEAGAMALGRVYDKIIVNEIKAGAVAASQEVGAYTTPVDPEILLKAQQVLASKEVPLDDGQVFAALDSVSWAVCMSFKQFANSDWVGPDLPFVRGGRMKTWSGIHVFHVDDSVLPLANTTERDNLMWHKSALGFGTLYEMRGSVQWENDPGQWTHNMRQRYGAKTLQGEGMVQMKGDYDPEHISLTA